MQQFSLHSAWEAIIILLTAEAAGKHISGILANRRLPMKFKIAAPLR
jgi:hypothetical protein